MASKGYPGWGQQTPHWQQQGQGNTPRQSFQQGQLGHQQQASQQQARQPAWSQQRRVSVDAAHSGEPQQQTRAPPAQNYQQQDWGAQKRPVGHHGGPSQEWGQKGGRLGHASGPSQAAPQPTPRLPETLVVFSKGRDTDEVVVRTLIGKYVEKGSNHGRKVFQKTAEKMGPDFVEVFLYYWDGRDGPAFEGWWFGNKLGGTQVWSHCTDSSLTPPTQGWKIPWDGGVRPTLLVMPEAQQKKEEADEKFKSVEVEVTKAVQEGQTAVDEAATLAGDYTVVDGLSSALQVLKPVVEPLTEAKKKLEAAQKGITGDHLKQFIAVGGQLSALLSKAESEMEKCTETRTKLVHDEKERALEEKDMVSYQDMLPEATEKANTAEDMVEKALITSEMIAAGDEMDEIKSAVDQTELATKQAQSSIGEARIYLNSKLAAARRFESQAIRNEAHQELTRLQTQLQEAQTKLQPLKSVRQDYLEKAAAMKLVQEVLERLSPAEVDADRAEEATVMLSGDSLTRQMLKEAESSVQKAMDHLMGVTKFIEAKKKTSTQVAKDELAKLEERAKVAHDRLVLLKTGHKEAHERVASDELVQQASDKVNLVQEAVGKAAEAEGPFLLGVEELPLDETLEAVKACEIAVAAAGNAVSSARMFIATKLVEVKRFSSAPSQDAQEKLQEFSGQLEASIKRLAELKSTTAGRKSTSLLRESENQVGAVEAAAKKLTQVAAPFADDSNLLEMSVEDIRKTAESIAAAEAEANAALGEARKFLTTRQIEAKGKDGSVDMSRGLTTYQTRLHQTQAEIAKSRRLSSSVDSRIAAKKVVEEAITKLQGVEEKVQSAVALVNGLEEAECGAEKEGIEERVKKAEASTKEATVALKLVTRQLESQSRIQSSAKEAIAKLQPRVQVAQGHLDGIAVTMRERGEKLTIKGIIVELSVKMTETEESVKRAAEAEAPFKKGDEMPVEEVTVALTELESVVGEASAAVGTMQSLLTKKNAAAKRLSEAALKSAAEDLAALQTRFDNATKTLSEGKKGMAERKSILVKREVASKVSEVETLVNAAVEATNCCSEAAASPGLNSEASEDMKNACVKAGNAQDAATTAINVTRALLMKRQESVRSSASSSHIVTECRKGLDRLASLQAELDKGKEAVMEQEHKFVARRLLRDATEKVEQLEQELESATRTADGLDISGDAATSASVQRVVAAFNQHLKATEKTTAQVFADIGGEVDLETFSAFVNTLGGAQESPFTQEELSAVFKAFNASGSGKMSAEEFQTQFRGFYMCKAHVSITDSLVVKNGKNLQKLEIGEVVQELQEPEKEPTLNVMRARGKSKRTGREGFITVAGVQGTVYLEPYTPPPVSTKEEVQSALASLGEHVLAVMKHLEQKCEDLKHKSSGPLGDVKTALMKMRPRVTKVQAMHKDVQRKTAEAERKAALFIESEKRRIREEQDRVSAQKAIDEATELVNGLDAEVEKHVVAAETLVKSKGADEESPLQSMAAVERDLEMLLTSVAQVLEKIRAQLDGISSPFNGPFNELRSTLVKLKVKANSYDTRSKRALNSLSDARKQVMHDAQQAVTLALRTHVQKSQSSADTLFKQLSSNGTEVPVQALRDLLKNIEGLDLKLSQVDLALDSFLTSGVTKLGLMGMLQEYQKCVKEIAVTSSAKVKDSKTLRRLELGEVVEVLELAQESNIERARCRALLDQKEGWVTLKGNQGTVFCNATPKPYMLCVDEVPLVEKSSSSSNEIRKIHPGEVFEVLEGPRKETPTHTQRVKGKASKDGKAGWVTKKDANGESLLELKSVLVCKTGVALTSAFDISVGRSVRKLEVGETLEMLDAAQDDDGRSLKRIRARAHSDDKEGWVTMTGNQGTTYVQESGKHHVCRKSQPLEKEVATGSAQVKIMEEGDVFEVLDGPKQDTKDGHMLARGRSIADCSEGWFVISATTMQPWQPRYKCVSPTALGDGLEVEASKDVRRIQRGELLEAVSSPVSSDNIMRVKVRSEKDSASGFVTIKGDDGTVFLESVPV